MGNRARSIGAVLAGAITGIVLSIGTDLALQAAGAMPALGQAASSPMLAVATVYRTLYGIAGSYLTARLAPNRPMAHAMALGILGLIACIAGAVTTWDKGPEFGPKWYALALLTLALPQSFLGGKLASRPGESEAGRG